MSHFINDDDDDDTMKALRAHSGLIEACLTIDTDKNFLDLWFATQQPIVTIECDNIKAWSQLKGEQTLNVHNWRKCGRADATITTQEPRFAEGLERLRCRQMHELFRQAARYRFDEAAEAEAAEATEAASKKCQEPMYQDYEKAFEQNMWEIESGTSGWCNKYPWQHELHPSGTAMMNRKRQREDKDMEELDVKRQKLRM